MYLRPYRTEDLNEIATLFYQTVHSVNAADYSKEQLDVWATGNIDETRWNDSLCAHTSIVAEEDGKIIGFGDIDHTGYLDRLYVHKDYQRRGVASAICSELEKTADGREITVHASITARPFFEKRGYVTERSQLVERGGVLLKNYVMRRPAPEKEQEGFV